VVDGAQAIVYISGNMSNKKWCPEQIEIQSACMPEEQKAKLGAVVADLRLAAHNASHSQRVAEAFMLTLISQNVMYKLSATMSGQYVAACIDMATEEIMANKRERP
jgi:hypothetical protein